MQYNVRQTKATVQEGFILESEPSGVWQKVAVGLEVSQS